MSKRCLNYLPWGPFDQIGPRMRPGLAQTGAFREHLVIRNNPIGGLFDSLRAFCSPLPQVQEGEDQYAAGDLSTPELTSFDQGGYGPPLDSGWFTPGLSFGPPELGTVLAPTGTTTMPTGQPAVAPGPDPAGREAATAARQALRTAIAARDCVGVQQVLDTARTNRGQPRTTAFALWQPLAEQAKDWLVRNRKKCGSVI